MHVIYTAPSRVSPRPVLVVTSVHPNYKRVQAMAAALNPDNPSAAWAVQRIPATVAQLDAARGSAWTVTVKDGERHIEAVG